MSRIYFHSPSGEAEVRGPERAMFGSYANDALANALRLRDSMFQDETLARVLPLLAKRPEYALINLRILETYLTVMGDAAFIVSGLNEPLSVFSCALNTLMATGSDPMILAARLHGQCEIHAWVDGPNRAWLAGIIERGLASGIYRPNMGWDKAMVLLCATDQEPVVTSYSVCEQFPNVGVAESAGLWKSADDDHDDWYALDVAEQWRLCMAALRLSEGSREMYPERWRWPDFHFGSTPTTAYQLIHGGLGGT